ncbi:hypothetical protein PENTCL1PPCAC_24580, partial [Pristionchus entomophagus]
AADRSSWCCCRTARTARSRSSHPCSLRNSSRRCTCSRPDTRRPHTVLTPAACIHTHTTSPARPSHSRSGRAEGGGRGGGG